MNFGARQMVEVMILHELFPLSARLPKMFSSAIFSPEEGSGRKNYFFGVYNRYIFSLNKIWVSENHDLHKFLYIFYMGKTFSLIMII